MQAPVALTYPVFEGDRQGRYTAVLWGVAFGNIVRGVAIDENKEYVGTFFDLLNPYALLGGLTTLLLFLTHGAIYLALKTDGGSGALEQMVLAEFCRQHFANHVPKLNKTLSAKLQVLRFH